MKFEMFDIMVLDLGGSLQGAADDCHPLKSSKSCITWDGDVRLTICH